MPEDTVSVRVRLRDSLKFKADADRSARAIDNIGDQAAQAARKIARMNAASSKTRVNIGPFSTSLRGAALWAGALTMATGKLTPVVLGAAEATATLVGGGGAAGGVGLLALAQGAGVAKLGMADLTDALGGNSAALKRLDPQTRAFFDTLHEKQQRLKRTAGSSMLPGLTSGAQAASRNFGILDRLVGRTGRTIGGLGNDAGQLLGSAGFGADLRTVGNANVETIDNLGHAGLNLADAFRHISVEAAPLAVWLSEEAKQGTQLVDVWAENARATGKMSRFFREARTDLTLLGSAGGHSGRGLINLFGAQDVDGTQTLRSLDRLTGRFERWTKSAKTQRNVGDAIVAEIPQAVGALMTAIANNLPAAGGTAAKVFFEGFIHADVWGKLLAGGFLAKKLGLFKLGKGAAGSAAGGGLGALLTSRGSKTNPMYVLVMNNLPDGPGGGGKKGVGRRLLDVVKTGAKAAPVVARVAGPEVAVATAGGLIISRAGHHNFPTTGGATLRREAAGRPDFVQNPFHHAPDAVQVDVTAPVMLEGREIARAHAKTIAALSARRK